jgi:hypothetical protein
MLGFKRFETAAVTMRGIELAEKNQETAVQPQTTTRKSNHPSGNMGQGLDRLESGKSFIRQKHIWK